MEHASKRKRLSYACNRCRQKKTRCDEQQPSCRNCLIAGVECLTTDKRRAGVVVSYRRRTGTVSTISETEVVRTPDSDSRPSPGYDRMRLSTQFWDRRGWQSGRLPMMPRFVGMSMFEIMTEWLDLAFYRLRVPPPYGTRGVVTAQVATLSTPQSPPVLPSAQEMGVFGQRFINTVHWLFPFIGEDEISRACDGSPVSSSQHAIVYMIAITGLTTEPWSPQSASTINAFISYCNTLLGHLVVERSLSAVQAILLFVIVLRSCDHIAWAWDILCLGVSMAQSIGINQTQPPLGLESDTQEHTTWWCMYVVEKILSFESGRSSLIWDHDLSCPFEGQNTSTDARAYKWACVTLANTLHEMQSRAAGTWRREEWLPQTVDEAIEEKIHTSGELAAMLDTWWQSHPSILRPGSAFGVDHKREQQSAFLSYYYHHALILSKRSVLLIETKEIREVVERYASGKPWKHHLMNGASICVEAARAIVRLTVALVDSGLPTYLTTLTSPLGAVYTLAVHILRERSSLLIRSDFELMKAGIAITRQHYQWLDSAQRVNDIMSSLEAYMVECLDGNVPQPFAVISEELRTSPDLSQPSPKMSPLTWGLSAADWAGWDWNDLSHLFAHGE
ncbi:hypothetical protein BJX99DRAFT_18476 [Aspergillus californicus]